MKTRERIALIRKILHEDFPEIFAGKGEPKTPLAVGIAHELAPSLPEIEAKHLGWALHDYVSGPTYLRNCLEGAARIGLGGAPQGTVSASEARYAAGRLRGLEHAEQQKARRNKPAKTADSRTLEPAAP